MIKQILIAAAILAGTATGAQAQNYDFDLILITGVPGAQGPVPVIFDGSFTYQNSTFSNVDIAMSGAWGPVALDRYVDGAFESSGPNPQSEFFLTFTTARPLGGWSDPITAVGLKYPSSAYLPIAPNIECGTVAISGDTCEGNITRVRAPEIDPATAASGLTLLLGTLVVLRSRRAVKLDSAAL
jgi:hypothetical protein